MLTDEELDRLALAAMRAACDLPDAEFAYTERDFWRRAVVAVLDGRRLPTPPRR